MAGTRIGINGFGRMGRLALRAAWDWPELEFVHVNELHGDAATAAHLLSSTRSTAAGRRGRSADGDALVDRRHAHRLHRRTPSPATCRGTTSASTSCSSAPGKFRTPESLAAVLRARRAEGHRRRAGEGRRAQHRRRRQRPPLRPERHHLLTAASCTTNCLAPVVKVIHEGIGIRHGVDHHAPRRDQHAGRRGRAAQGPAPRPRGGAVADPDDHRARRRRSALIFPELKGKLERPRRPRAAAQRLADRLRLRGRAADDGRGGQRAARGRGRRAARRASSATRSGRWSPSTSRTTRARHRRRALDDGRRRHAGEDPRLVRQRVGLRRTA